MTEPSELSRRQPFRRSATSNRSSSTVNSYEIQAASDYGAADDELSYGNTINQSFQLNSCTDTVLGDRVTNIYNNFLARGKFWSNDLSFSGFKCIFDFADSNNPAFILSDTNVGLDKKIKFTLTRRWFWIYVLLIVMMVTAFLVIGQVLSFVAIRSIAVETDWGKREPEPGLIPLRLPVVQVIVVDTADEDECCPTREECVRRLRAMQVFYRNYLKDVPFNFMIGCDGMVYAGRGFHFQGEIFAPPTNISESLIKSESMARITDLSRIMAYDKLVGIDELSQADENIFVLAFIGNFSEQPPSLEMLQTFTDFLSRSAGQDMLAEDYTFVTQKQLESPENSDDALTVALRQLPHFQESETYFNITLRDEWLSNMTLLSRIERSTRTDFGVTTIHLAMINYGCSDLVTIILFSSS